MKKKTLIFLSLFFSQTELKMLSNHLKAPGEISKNLSLNSLLYLDDTHWSLWINQKLFHPQNIHDLENYELKKVTPQGAHFFCSLDQKSFILKPNQVYVPLE